MHCAPRRGDEGGGTLQLCVVSGGRGCARRADTYLLLLGALLASEQPGEKLCCRCRSWWGPTGASCHGAFATVFSLHCDHSKSESFSRCQHFRDLLPSLLSTVRMALPALGIGDDSFSYPRKMASPAWRELPGKESLRIYNLYSTDHTSGTHGQNDPSSLCPEGPHTA